MDDRGPASNLRHGITGTDDMRPYERSAEEVNIVGRIRWFAREV